MNNDLAQFSEERLIQMVKFCEPSIHGLLKHFETSDVAALARIALAAKQAKPVNSPCEKCNGSGFMDSGGTQPWGEPISVQCDCTTQQPAHTEQDGWIKCSERMPEDMEDVLVTDGEDVKSMWWNGSEWDSWVGKHKFTIDGDDITYWMPLPAAPKPEPK